MTEKSDSQVWNNFGSAFKSFVVSHMNRSGGVVAEIRFAESLRRLIEMSPHARNRSAIWKSLNISSAALSQYLSGSSRPRLEVLVDLAEFFDVSLDELVLGSRPSAEISEESLSVIQHVDWAVSDMRRRAGEQAWLTVRVGEILTSRIRSEVERVSKSDRHPGVFADREILELEEHSLDTVVLTRNLEYDLLRMGDQALPGRFGGVVARNILRDPPRRYRFLVDPSAAQSSGAREYLSVLLELVGGNVEALKRVEVRAAHQPLFAALTYLQLDHAALSRVNPALALNVERFLTNSGHLVFQTAANQDLAGDVPCEPAEAEHLIRAQNKVWAYATPLS